MDWVFLDRRGAPEMEWLDGDNQLAAPFNPPTDIVETADAVEIVVDVPGVQADAIRVTWTGGMLVIAGRKPTMVFEPRDTTFHLAERRFGRFVTAVRPTGAVEARRARAVLHGGELRVVMPRVDERRGRKIRIDVTTA